MSLISNPSTIRAGRSQQFNFALRAQTFAKNPDSSGNADLFVGIVPSQEMGL